MAISPVSLSNRFSKTGGSPIFTIKVSNRIAARTKMKISRAFDNGFSLFSLFDTPLTKRMLTQIRTIRAKEFENTFFVAVINSPGSHNSLENRDSIPNLKKNMMIIAVMIHVMWYDDNVLDSECLLLNKVRIPTIPHPIISVVIRVERGWIIRLSLMNRENM